MPDELPELKGRAGQINTDKRTIALEDKEGVIHPLTWTPELDVVMAKWKTGFYLKIQTDGEQIKKCAYWNEGKTEMPRKQGGGRTIITGIRWQESIRRRSRPIFHKSDRRKETWFLNPIVDWHTVDVWDFLNQMKISHCTLYDEGRTRIGCILCPFHPLAEKLDDIERYPKYARAYRRTTDKLYKKFKEKGYTKWESSDALWNWWIYGKDQDSKTKQEQLSIDAEQGA